MGDVVFIDVSRREKAVTMQEAWDAYVAAQARAKETLNVEDGIRAGKAWRQWVELFVRKP